MQAHCWQQWAGCMWGAPVNFWHSCAQHGHWAIWTLPKKVFHSRYSLAHDQIRSGIRLIELWLVRHHTFNVTSMGMYCIVVCFLVSTHICPPQSFTCDTPPLCRKWVSIKVQDLHEDLCNLQMLFVNKMPCTVAHVLALEACPLHDVLYYSDQVFSHTSQAAVNWALEVFHHGSQAIMNTWLSWFCVIWYLSCLFRLKMNSFGTCHSKFLAMNFAR